MSSDNGFPDYAEFSKAAIFRNLANINLFSMVIEVPRVYQWINTPTAALVLSRLYDETVRALNAAEFYSIENLKPKLSQNQVSVEFDDDSFGFAIYFDEDGDLRIQRPGSSFSRFYEWYRRFMPSLESLVSRTLQAVAEEMTISRPGNSGFRPELTPVRASYRFRFVAYDFHQPPSTAIVRNSSVMTRLVQSLPGTSGHLLPVNESEFEEFGRMDVMLNRWSEHPMGYVREAYAVQAPGNRAYSSIWLDLSYIGEARSDADGGRSPFNSSLFLNQVEMPLVEFLRKRALEAFVADLTRGFVFDTTPSSLP